MNFCPAGENKKKLKKNKKKKNGIIVKCKVNVDMYIYIMIYNLAPCGYINVFLSRFVKMWKYKKRNKRNFT